MFLLVNNIWPSRQLLPLSITLVLSPHCSVHISAMANKTNTLRVLVEWVSKSGLAKHAHALCRWCIEFVGKVKPRVRRRGRRSCYHTAAPGLTDRQYGMKMSVKHRGRHTQTLSKTHVTQNTKKVWSVFICSFFSERSSWLFCHFLFSLNSSFSHSSSSCRLQGIFCITNAVNFFPFCHTASLHLICCLVCFLWFLTSLSSVFVYIVHFAGDEFSAGKRRMIFGTTKNTDFFI